MEDSNHRPRVWRDRDFAAFSALVLLHFLVLSAFLVYPDFTFAYPFMGGDSQDWIANGLFLAGHDVTYTARPPLLPLVLAALSRLELLDFYPLFAQLLAHSTICGLYALLRLDSSRTIAATVSAAWLLNTTWLKLSIPVMADVPAASLLFWCVFFWRRSAYRRSGLLGGLSAVTQPLALVLAAPMLLVRLGFHRREGLTRRGLAAGLLFAAPMCGWLVYKKLAVGVVGDFSLRHWSLLTPHLDSLGYYACAALAFVGPIAFAGILLGSLSFLRRAHRDPWCFFLLAAVGAILGFFVLLYDFNSMRFLAYVFPLGAVLLAEGLRVWTWPGRRVVFLGVLLWAVLPAPGPRADPTRIALWPFPPTYLKAADGDAGGGSRWIDPLDVEIEVRRLSEVLPHHPYQVVADPRRGPRRPRGLAADVVRDDLWAVYFYDDLSRAGTGTVFATRMGNLLSKRVHYLPSSVFGPAWERLVFRRLGELDGQTVFRARIPGREGSWAVLVRAGGTAEAKILASEPGASEPGPRPDDSDLDLAETVAPHLADRAVAILAPESGLAPWQVYLPFVARMHRFLVTEHEREAGTRGMLDSGRTVARWGEVVLREHSVFGRPWIVIEIELNP